MSPRLCPRYSARIVQDIQLSSSPSWMQFRLESCGIRAINSVVDVTNYVMLETGQPLHAFDLDRLTTKRIVVRVAGKLRNFITLDGIERALTPEDLLICDGDTPVALAGVMGGQDSEVVQNTRVVLLESANFNSVSIRRTAKRLGLHSEASHRFERGVDPEGTLYALDRAAYLLAEIAQGSAVKGVVDRYPRRIKEKPILLRYEKVKGLLGIELKPREIERTFKSLGLKIQGRAKNGLKALPPSYRRDLGREADLIEELARLHGYEKIPTTTPLVRAGTEGMDLRLRRERNLRSFLAGEGLTETINLPFTSEGMNRHFRGLWDNRRSPVPILNPLNQENTEMRLSLIPGLLGNLRTNLAQKVNSFWGFDLGKTFSLDEKGVAVERQQIGGLIYGQRGRKGLVGKEEKTPTFLDVKGLVQGILESLGLERGAVWTNDGLAPYLHPGKAAALQWNGSAVGYLGEICPDLREGLGLPPFLVLELDFEGLLQYAPRELAVRVLPRFPSVERDLAVVVDEEFPAQRIISWIEKLSHSLIEDVQVFDQYSGSPIPEGKKSLAYKISYRAEERTLTDAEVNALHQNIIAQMTQVFGAQLRG
jgi:phenylalanyl-tRNA synthetase beta chain